MEYSEQTKVRTWLGLGSRRNRGVNGRGRDTDSNRGIDYRSGSRLDDARVSRGVKAKETTKFVCLSLITTSMAKGAMWHDFSYPEGRKGRKKGMWG
jgi:hypothetical protein